MLNGKSNTVDRELVVSHLLNAPVELVWAVWTHPWHVKNWWGPNGFTCTITKMAVMPGGEWNLVMHGPDGTNYKNKSMFREIIPNRKIVYVHESDPKFIATIEFEDQGEQTYMHWHMLFESEAQFLQVVKTYKADEGLKQNIEKLNKYVSQFYKI